MSLDDRNAELEKKLEISPVEKNIEVLVRDAAKRKRQVRLLAASLVFDLLLTVGLATISLKTNETAHLAQSNRDAVLANCETSNDSRKNNRALWDFAFALTPTQPPTEEQKAQTALFKEFVAKTFAERDCQAEINKQ